MNEENSKNHGIIGSDFILETAARCNDQQLVERLLVTNRNSYFAVQGAMLGGHEGLFDWIRSKYPGLISMNWEAIITLCPSGGNVDFFKKICSLMSPGINPDFNTLAANALHRGHREMFDYILNIAPSPLEWNWCGLAQATFPHRKLFDYVRGIPEHHDWDWPRLIYGALDSGSIEMFEYIYQLSPYRDLNWRQLANIALHGGLEMFDYFYLLAPNRPHIDWDWNLYLSNSILKGLNFLLHVYSLVPPGVVIDWLPLARRAFDFHPEIFNWIWLLSLKTNYPVTWNDLLVYILEEDPPALIPYYVKKIDSMAPRNTDWNWDEIYDSLESIDLPVVYECFRKFRRGKLRVRR